MGKLKTWLEIQTVRTLSLKYQVQYCLRQRNFIPFLDFPVDVGPSPTGLTFEGFSIEW